MPNYPAIPSPSKENTLQVLQSLVTCVRILTGQVGSEPALNENDLKTFLRSDIAFNLIQLAPEGVVYFGDSRDEGTFRIRRSGSALVAEKLSSGTWTSTGIEP
jgi:hypothetical protein